MGDVPAKSNECILCGANLEDAGPYLTASGGILIRACAYLLPVWALRSLNSRRQFSSVIINKELFLQRRLFWCSSCRTGYALPPFTDAELNRYYQECYWTSREQHESFFNKDLSLPSDQKLKLAQDRLDWVDRHGVKFSTSIDFGAGDCAGAYLMAKKCGLHNAFVVDSSNQTKVIANSMGLNCSSSLEKRQCVEFIYASHSIEHVADIIHTFNQLANSVCDGGYVFLETPNVPEKEILVRLVMTPHTFMLSEHSFKEISKFSELELVAFETVGPEWRKYNKVTSRERTDLRVLFRKRRSDTPKKLGRQAKT